jgi:hypothetical protein
MQTRVGERGLVARLAVAILGLMLPLEGCSDTVSPNLGKSYSCSATATCVVGQSYCSISIGGAGGAGGSGTLYTGASCVAIPQGTSCAANPTCDCVCHGGCEPPNMCSDADNLVVVTKHGV